MKFSELEYIRPDIKSVTQEFTDLIDQFRKADTLEEQTEILDRINVFRNDFETSGQLASVRYSIDTTNSFYEGEQDAMDNIRPHYTGLVHQFYIALTQSLFRKELAERFGDQLFTIAELNVKAFKDEVITDLQKENHLTSQYTKLIASAKIDFEGEERNLSGLDPFQQSEDRSMRKKAHEAYFSFFAQNADQFDTIYDDLVQLRHGISRKLNFNNFVELAYVRLMRSDYSPKMIAGFRENIAKYVVPLSNAIREKQAKRVGISDLKYYDLNYFYPDGNPKPQGKPDWIVENGKKMYAELSNETGEFFDFMLKNEMMDLVNKKGKAAGGYCTMFPKYGSPFIFSNFNGTSHDIDVLTHEAGHAFQVFSSRNFDIQEYYWPTYEACEIHSMSMEFFTWPWMKLFFKQDEEKYKYDHISSSILFLPYGVSVDEFQHYVYENPTASPADRKRKWREIEQKYTPYKDYNGNDYLNNGGYWQRQGHIYNSPFYYIDYTLAQICAFQFWIRMNKDWDAAWSDYLTLCKAGGSKSFLDLVKLANLRSPFEEDCIKEVVDTIYDWLDKNEPK